MFLDFFASSRTRQRLDTALPALGRIARSTDGATAIVAISIIGVLVFVLHASLALPLDRSLWYDEYHIAWRLSQYSLWDVFTNSFDQNVGRMPGYMILNEILFYFNNTPESLRAANFLIFFLTISILVYMSVRTGMYFVATVCVICLLSDDYIQMLNTFKPYTWDMLAIMCSLAVIMNLKSGGERTHWTALITISAACLFTHLAWPLMASVSGWKIWRIASTGQSFAGTIKRFKEEISRYRVHAAIMAGIWIYLLQYIGRYFFGGDEVFFSYVVVEQTTRVDGFIPAVVSFFSTTNDILATFGGLAVSSDMPFKLIDFANENVGNILTIAFFSTIWLGGRTNIIVVSSIFISFALSLVGDWPFDDERWSMANILLFATPIAFALERLSAQSRMAAGVLLLGFLLIQIPAKAHPNGMTFYSEAYQYSRLHPSTSTEETLRWLDQRLVGERVIILADSTSFLGFEYYVDSAGRPGLHNLANAQRIVVGSSERIDHELDALTGNTLALFHFHHVGRVSGQVRTIEENCNVIDHLRPNDRLDGDHRVMRAEAIIFTCD